MPSDAPGRWREPCQRTLGGPLVNEFPQAQMPGEGGRQEQAGIGHQAVIVKDDTDTGGVVAW